MARLTAILNWFTKPASTLPESERRRVHLLALLLFFILVLMVVTLIFVLILTPPDNPRRGTYPALILALIALVAFAYALNRLGHYNLSAGLTVACAVLAPWGSLALDSTVWRGDFVPLTYVAISILLSSLLLPTWITVGLAAFQWVGLVLVFWFSPSTSFNWASLLGFVFFTSVLSILANDISQRDLKQIERQARLLALSEAQLREQSIRDHLTNLYNRRYLEETLESEVQRAALKAVPLGIIMMDIDHFKHYNDTLGHHAGDILLQELGKLLTEQVRRSDLAYRYGGDEIILILSDASLGVVKRRAERLRGAVKNLHLGQNDPSLPNLTISLGVAVFPDHGSTGAALMKSADAALYRAKSEGRDRVVVVDES
jgi:diguanylate cyclase (GGDEF)-like protein